LYLKKGEREGSEREREKRENGMLTSETAAGDV
jgi:hypothetical protein